MMHLRSYWFILCLSLQLHTTRPGTMHSGTHVQKKVTGSISLSYLIKVFKAVTKITTPSHNYLCRFHSPSHKTLDYVMKDLKVISSVSQADFDLKPQQHGLKRIRWSSTGRNHHGVLSHCLLIFWSLPPLCNKWWTIESLISQSEWCCCCCCWPLWQKECERQVQSSLPTMIYSYRSNQ